MRYFSDVTKKVYATEKECREAETKAMSYNSVKQKRKEEIEHAYKVMNDAKFALRDAEKNFDILMQKYTNEYGFCLFDNLNGRVIDG